MRGVSKRAVVVLSLFLSAHAAFAAPRRDDSWLHRIRHMVVTILDQLGIPPG
jgi:hypothetical protein